MSAKIWKRRRLKAKLRRARTDVVYFAKFILGVPLDRWQVLALRQGGL